MKYLKEYEEADNKKEFIRILLVRYNHIKASTAQRRYYDLKKFAKETVVGDISQPGDIKLLMLEDMKKMNFRINEIELKKHGFTFGEINWLKQEGLFK